MENFEERGRSLEEAVKKAEEKLGRKLRATEYTIKESGSRGVLGLIGARAAIIEVKPQEGGIQGDFGDERIKGLAIQSAEDLLDHMGLPGRALLELSEGYYKVDLEMEEDDGGIIIGRRGSTLEAFQHMLRRLVEKEVGSSVPIVVDVGGYRVRRRDALIQRALKFADQVKRTGKRITLDSMPPGERRAVHMALKPDRGISTYSVGNEPERKIVIASAGGGKSSRKPRKTERPQRREQRSREPSPETPRETVTEPERVNEIPISTEPTEPSVQEITPSTEMSYGRKRVYRRPRNRPVKPSPPTEG